MGTTPIVTFCDKKIKHLCPFALKWRRGSVASHQPQEKKIIGSNPAKCYIFRTLHTATQLSICNLISIANGDFWDKYIHKYQNCPGGVAQWTSHPPEEQEDPGSNPARV
jgi:hypothetical protein